MYRILSLLCLLVLAGCQSTPDAPSPASLHADLPPAYDATFVTPETLLAVAGDHAALGVALAGNGATQRLLPLSQRGRFGGYPARDRNVVAVIPRGTPLSLVSLLDYPSTVGQGSDYRVAVLAYQGQRYLFAPVKRTEQGIDWLVRATDCRRRSACAYWQTQLEHCTETGECHSALELANQLLRHEEPDIDPASVAREP